MCTAVLIGWEPATPPPPSHLGSCTRAQLVSQHRRHLCDPLTVIDPDCEYLCELTIMRYSGARGKWFTKKTRKSCVTVPLRLITWAILLSVMPVAPALMPAVKLPNRMGTARFPSSRLKVHQGALNFIKTCHICENMNQITIKTPNPFSLEIYL